jgi:hypothetical protein
MKNGTGSSTSSLTTVLTAFNISPLVESKAGIIPRSSLLNLGVQLSPHPASDVLSFRVCSCEYNRGSFRVWLEGF